MPAFQIGHHAPQKHHRNEKIHHSGAVGIHQRGVILGGGMVVFPKRRKHQHHKRTHRQRQVLRFFVQPRRRHGKDGKHQKGIRQKQLVVVKAAAEVHKKVPQHAVHGRQRRKGKIRLLVVKLPVVFDIFGGYAPERILVPVIAQRLLQRKNHGKHGRRAVVQQHKGVCVVAQTRSKVFLAQMPCQIPRRTRCQQKQHNCHSTRHRPCKAGGIQHRQRRAQRRKIAMHRAGMQFFLQQQRCKVQKQNRE